MKVPDGAPGDEQKTKDDHGDWGEASHAKPKAADHCLQEWSEPEHNG